MASNLFEFDARRLLRWVYGGPFEDFWLKNVNLIEIMVRDHKLKPLNTGKYVMGDFVAGGIEESFEGASFEPGAESLAQKAPIPPILKPQRGPFWPRPFPGGLRIPHLHFKGDVFLLDDRQWNELSSAVLEGFKEKLNRAKSVSFEQIMKLSDGFDTLT
ncbi:MAG: hypothetical protein KBF37_12220 [Saprospiraceae bacterium]|jgi:hypothetical protein|nr:hypothetical protein [Saprospiraceae bacterium]MBV6472168.1 hypothetical protein [Saprospiraceae bacterium]